MNKKHETNCKITASRLKQKFTTLRKQDALSEAFYNELDEGVESFLGNWVIDEDDIAHDYELESQSDNNEAENEADVTKTEQETEEIKEGDVYMEYVVKEKQQMNSKILHNSMKTKVQNSWWCSKWL